MSKEFDTIASHYRLKLEGYILGAGELALQSAYELGRTIIASSLGVLDLARIHQESVALILSGGSGEESREIVRKASEFFTEALSPFEMTHRGFQEAIAALHRSNETLEEQVIARAAALTRTQEQFRIITDNASDLIYILDLEGKFIYASPSFKRILGYSFEDLGGINCLELIHTDDRDRVAEVLRRALFSPEGLSVEFRYIHQDGRYVPFESIWNWVVDENGIPQRAVVDSREISERKKTEERLRASELRYRRLFEASEEGIILIDVDLWTVSDVNPTVAGMLGYDLADLNGVPMGRIPALAAIAAHLKPLRENHGEEASMMGDLRLPRKNGRTIEVEAISNVFLLGTKRVIQCVLHDISVRKRYERRQAAQHEITRILSESGSVADASRPILKAVCRILGWEVGVFWSVDRRANNLRCIDIWHAPGIDISGFERETRSRTIPSGVGLAGQVWVSREPQLLQDILGSTLARPPVIEREALRGGFGFPVRIGGDILGVIECYSRNMQPPDEDLFALMAVLGNQIGQFLERKYTEESLRESEEQYRTMAETASDAILVLDENGTIVFVNSAAEAIFGYHQRELPGNTLSEIIPEYQRLNFLDSMLRTANTGERKAPRHGIEVAGLHRSGRSIPLEISYGETLRNGRKYFIGIARDITDRKHVEEIERRAQEQMRNLSARLQTAREEERRWIAREIHDELGQALTGIKMYLSWMLSKVGNEKNSALAPLLTAKMNAISQLVDTTIVSVQKIVTELRPGVLDDLGLLAAIEWQGQEFENRTGIRCEIDSTIQDARFDEQRSTAVFRIFQETLTNVARHAKATRVTVRLETSGGKLLMQVHDNGKGIREEEISAAKSLGLLGIRERVNIFGGEVDIYGIPENGTTVAVVIPLEDSPGAAAVNDAKEVPQR